VKATVFPADRQVVNAGVSLAHQADIIELPVLVAERSEPIAAVVMPFICKPDGNPVAVERSQLLDETVVELPPPLCCKKSDNSLPAIDELGAVTPLTINCVSQRDLARVPAIPPIFGKPHFLGSSR
jgi:hypothetical protein